MPRQHKIGWQRVAAGMRVGKVESTREIAKRADLSLNYTRSILRALQRSGVAQRRDLLASGHTWEGCQAVLEL